MLRHSFLHDLVVDARPLSPVVSFLNQPQVGVVEELLLAFKRGLRTQWDDVVYMSRFYTIPLIAVNLLKRTKQIVVQFWSLQASESRDELAGAVLAFSLVHHGKSNGSSGLGAEREDGIFLHSSGSTAVEGILSLTLVIVLPLADLNARLLFVTLIIVMVLLQQRVVLVRLIGFDLSIALSLLLLVTRSANCPKLVLALLLPVEIVVRVRQFLAATNAFNRFCHVNYHQGAGRGSGLLSLLTKPVRPKDR